MKIRMGFVSNSSSSSFVILFKGNEDALREKLDAVFSLPEGHPLNDVLGDVAGLVANRIDEEVTTEKKLLEVEHYIPLSNKEALEKINAGFHLFLGSFSDDYEGGLEGFFCNNGMNYKSDDLVIMCDGGH